MICVFYAMPHSMPNPEVPLQPALYQEKVVDDLSAIP